MAAVVPRKTPLPVAAAGSARPDGRTGIGILRIPTHHRPLAGLGADFDHHVFLICADRSIEPESFRLKNVHF